MALEKGNLAINFSQGLNTKSDPFQIPPGQFLALENTVFTKAGLLQKRNGFKRLADLVNSDATYLTTYNNDLTAIGSTLQAYSQGSDIWVEKGSLQPVTLDTMTLIRSTTNQSQVDTAFSNNGLICTVYTDNVPVSGVLTQVYKFAVADKETGQNIIAPQEIVPISGSVSSSPRVFYLNKYFVLVFTSTALSTDSLQYVAINTVTLEVLPGVNISSNYIATSSLNFDGIVVNNTLYVAWNGGDLGGAIRMTYIDSNLGAHTTSTFLGKSCTILSLSADFSRPTPTIYVSFYDLATQKGYLFIVNQILNTILPFTQIISGIDVANITLIADKQIATIIYEVINTYSYDANIETNYIESITCTQAGVVGTANEIKRSVGLASKAFINNSNIYFLTAYDSIYQPTYFLIDLSGNIISKLAYSNGGGYLRTGLPSVTIESDVAYIGYLIKDTIQSTNKLQGAPNTNGIYSQTGVNLVSFKPTTDNLTTAEIGNDLHLSGGFLWMYDGYLPVEHGFFLWPDYVEATPSTTGGGLKAQKYFYQVTYEWADNQGNVFRSAPSIPLSVDLTSSAPTPITFTSSFSTGDTDITVSSVAGLQVGQYIDDSTTPANIQPNTYITAINGLVLSLSLPTAGTAVGDTLQTVQTNSVTLDIPTLRLTYKVPNPVKIVVYRWSESNQVYYQTTSLTLPVLNDTTVDSVQFVDTNADDTIIGNNILYTTGGVVENIAAPATNTITLYKSRLFLVDAEDKNLLWYSKQVIQNTPVEMSDLFTLYVAPTTSAQGNTGDITSLAPMDDKLIIFKRDAIYYIVGNGPDNTGANNDFSEPVFITSTVGCVNQKSIVFIPSGLMFQSDKGIWLLGRDLNTTYIGAPVEKYNNDPVLASLNIPGTNQVRFTLTSGITLMYDYFYQQWGSFTNIPGISSTLYQNYHSYINSLGQVFQETPNTYLDGSSPVLMSFTTGWLNLAGVQGFERAYFFYLLGTYISPHKLQVQVAYDYAPSASQISIITPDNYNAPWGGDALWGSSSPWGGTSAIEQWRVFFQQQKCQSFQITLTELFDPSYGTSAGAGLTLSGLDVIVGIKGTYPRIKPARSVG